jgi:hypothetical protein
MQVTDIAVLAARSQPLAPPPPAIADEGQQNPSELRDAFTDFVGQTFYGHLLAAMRKTVGKPAYFHGGRTEEVFQSQLDQVWAEKMTDSTAARFAGPMWQLFQLPRF